MECKLCFVVGYSILISGIPRPLLLSEEEIQGGSEKPQIPRFWTIYFGKFTKNITNFPAVFGGLKGEIQGGNPKGGGDPRNTTISRLVPRAKLD